MFSGFVSAMDLFCQPVNLLDVYKRQREEWLQAGVKVEVKGEMTRSVHNGKPDLSCRVEELSLYVPETDNSNQ